MSHSLRIDKSYNVTDITVNYFYSQFYTCSYLREKVMFMLIVFTGFEKSYFFFFLYKDIDDKSNICLYMICKLNNV